MPKIFQEIKEVKYLINGDIIQCREIDTLINKNPYYFNSLEMIENYIVNNLSYSIFGNILFDDYYVYTDGKAITNISGTYHTYDLGEILKTDKISTVKIFENNKHDLFVKIDNIDIQCSTKEKVLEDIFSTKMPPIVCLIGEEKYNEYIELERKSKTCNIF